MEQLTEPVAIAVGTIVLAIVMVLVIGCCSGDESSNEQQDEAMLEQIQSALSLTREEAGRMVHEASSSTPSQIEPRLYLGNAAAAADLGKLRALRINYIVNATSNLPNHWEGRGLEYLSVPVEDSLASDLGKYLDTAAIFIARALSDPYASDAVLVHCQQGVSRSATIVLAFLMRERGMSLDAAIAWLHKRRWIRPNEAFHEQLRAYEAALVASR